MRTRHLINPLVARTRQGTLRTADPLASGPDPARQWFRRGNALIMAVSLTVLLAIIGSAFVLMSRMDRQSVVGVQSAALADAAVDATIRIIQQTLVNDIIASDPSVEFSKRLLNVEKGIQPYDGLDANNKWLAAIEPVLGADGNPRWPQVSEILPDPDNTNTIPSTRNFQASVTLSDNWADADGDGISDSVWRELPGFQSEGKSVLVAVRIIDNCGMVNVNTAWKRNITTPHLNVARSVGRDAYDSYGEFLHQVDLHRLLNRYGIDPDDARGDALRVHDVLMNSQTFRTTSFDVQSILYDHIFIRDYGWFGLLPAVVAQSRPSPAQPFGIEDMLELRNRFTINSSAETAIETAMMQTLGLADAEDPTGQSGMGSYRILPYDSNYNVLLWYAHLTNDDSKLTPAELNNRSPRSQQRHLLTTYSFDREVRPPPRPVVKQKEADDWLDIYANSFLGKYRKVNVNQVLQTWFNTALSLEERKRAVLRLAYAFQAVGLYQDEKHPLDLGLQFVANLIDYVDTDGLPTIFPVSEFGAFGATRDIFGTEQQPLITEVFNSFNSVDGTDKPTDSAVEIYNPPYNAAINLSDWELRFGSEWTLVLGTDTDKDSVIPPGGRVVYTWKNSLGLTDTTGVKIVTGRKTTTNVDMVFDVFDPATSSAGPQLLLVRTGVTSDWGTSHEIAIDRVKDMDQVLQANGTAQSYSIWRAVRDPDASPYWAPWASTRNQFFSGSQALGNLNKVTTPTDALNRSGTPIRVDNRGPLDDASLRNVDTSGAWKPGVDPLPKRMWQVHGWHELGRVLLVGNPSVSDLLNDTTGTIYTITDAIAYAGEAWSDTNKDGMYDAATEAVTRNLNSDPLFNPLYLDERQLRLDFTWLDMKLMDCISLVSPADDGIDNDNADGDSKPDYTADPVVDPGMYTGADDLLECRIPGRINVNTAPEAVLKALFPALWTYEMKWDNTANQYVPTGSYIPLTADELDMISGWYAKAIIYLRNKRTDRDAQNRGGPFVSLADLFDRLDKFDNPKLNADGERDPTGTAVIPELSAVLDAWVSGPAHPNCLRFGILVDAVKFERADRPRVYWDTHRSQLVGVTPVGYVEAGSGPMIGDFEERDWIFSRMANLLTVRSDSFTAYIAVRVQDIERRYVAILDRSNVFLPESAARNGSFWNSDTGSYTDDSGEMAIYDPKGERYGPSALNDPDYFDRQYVTPRVVALRQVPDPR